MHGFIRFLGVASLMLAGPHVSFAIIVRHDRSDDRYLELAKSYVQIVHMNTQKPGNPPDGEGALVGSSWVVTAAHIAELIEPGHVVTAGGKDYAAEAVYLHPEWDHGPNDIALVKLAGVVEGITPARLYREHDEQGRIVIVVGLGETGTGLTGPTSNDGRLRGATNRVDTASDFWLKFKFDKDGEATDLEGISGPGDSGGPAFLDSDGVRYLLGVSSGQSTRATGGREGFYGVTEYYTRVSSYAEWLDSVMNPPGKEAPSESRESGGSGAAAPAP